MASKTQEGEEKAGTVVAPNAFQGLILKMAGMATLEEREAPSGEDIIPILEAETEEEMWDADERPTYNAKMLSGTALQILGFSVKYSGETDTDIQTPFVNPANGRQMYLLVTAFRLNHSGEKKEINLPTPGEVFTWNTSARNIVGKLFWMLGHGWFDDGAKPVRLRIEGTSLAGGKKSIEKLKQLEDNIVIEAAAPLVVEEPPPF